MPEQFVPFLNALRNGQASNGSKAADGFKPMVVPQSGAASGAGASGHSHKPVITIKKDGDVISEIHIQCACGEVIQIACSY